jgi:hypothetical protein
MLYSAPGIRGGDRQLVNIVAGWRFDCIAASAGAMCANGRVSLVWVDPGIIRVDYGRIKTGSRFPVIQ